MRILALSHSLPGVTREQMGPHMKAEAARVWELYQAGALREVYFREDGKGAVILLECDSIAEAHSLITSLPLVEKKLIDFDVMGLTPYPGYAALFAEPK